MSEKQTAIISVEKYVKWGKIICWFSIVYNCGEGVVSIILGEEESSISLVVFGIQSFIEITSSILVLLRFYYFEKHDIKERVCTTEVENNETDIEKQKNEQLEEEQSKKFLKAERVVTVTIGIFFVILSIVTIIVSSLALHNKEEPSSTVDNIIISCIGVFFMYISWYIKSKVAKTLNSASIAGDASCNLACIKLTIVLLIGSLVFTLWKGGWWVDSSIAIILALFFFKEGYSMLKWGLSKNFTGGCGDCCGGGKKLIGEQNGKCSSEDKCNQGGSCGKTGDCSKSNQCETKADACCGSKSTAQCNNDKNTCKDKCSETKQCSTSEACTKTISCGQSETCQKQNSCSSKCQKNPEAQADSCCGKQKNTCQEMNDRNTTNQCSSKTNNNNNQCNKYVIPENQKCCEEQNNKCM